jgi:hypothetical protein
VQIDHEVDFQRDEDVVINEAHEYQESSSKDAKSNKRERSLSTGINTRVELTVEELK